MPNKNQTPEHQGQQPEALAQFAKSARRQKPDVDVGKLEADDETSPIPTDNEEKHSVAEELLNEGAHGEEPDPDSAGANDLPDRITDKRKRPAI